MISQTKNRVQALKGKFENLNNENKIPQSIKIDNDKENTRYNENINKETENLSDSSEEWPPRPNSSYLYSKSDVKRSINESKKSLVRQTSDPGKKLHRSHAFRCDRSQKVVSPKRHGSCYGRSETGDFTLKTEKKLSKDRLKRLGNLLEDQMRKENFVCKNNDLIVGEVEEVKNMNSIPDSEVPQHILDQYAKVVKRNNDKQDAMTDSGVSSETENLEDEKSGKIKKIVSQFEKAEEEKPNLVAMNNLSVSSDTIKLERKNPHLILTDTLKKALKQPLPAGPPPKKPPRTFIATIPESPEKKKDPKKMLEKLEQVLQKRESQSPKNNTIESSKPKEIHYLCTEILDITQRTLLPNQTSNCFKSLNCTNTKNSTLSLPYTRLSQINTQCCTCSNDNLNRSSRLSTFLSQPKCAKCQINDEKDDRFKCFLNCKCKSLNCKFYVDEHIYDVPCNDYESVTIGRKSGRSNHYGSLNVSKSLEDLRIKTFEDTKIYDIPCDISRPATPEISSTSTSPSTSPKTSPKTSPITKMAEPKTDFEKLLQNFEKGFDSKNHDTKKTIICNDYPSLNNHDKKKSTISNDYPKTEDLSHLTNKTDEEKFGIKKRNSDSKFNSIKEQISNFEDSRRFNTEKPPMKPKPLFVKKNSKSSENLINDLKCDTKNDCDRINDSKHDKRNRRERKESGVSFSPNKKDNSQLDVDKENLNRLMTEIYETVTAGCSMENKPGSFPTHDEQDNTSEESVKITRSLTEKRKNYVRRVSSRVGYSFDKPRTRYRHQTSICSYRSEPTETNYNTFRSWKSFRTSQNNLNSSNKMADVSDSKFNLTDSSGNLMTLKDEFGSTDSLDTGSIDEKTGCVDIELPFEPRERSLFNVCLLVGLNYMTGQAYVKSVFPAQVQVPPHIENLIFPETLSSTEKGEWLVEASGTQCYSLILTDERGERSYGYCRRVLPEGATTCLPLCYCLIGKYRAPGFYYKVLQEIESHHGSSDVEIHSILQQLFEKDFPNPGEEITISYTKTCQTKTYRNSMGEGLKCKTMPDIRRRISTSPAKSAENVSQNSTDFNRKSDNCDDVFEDKKVPDFYDVENNNSPKKITLCFDGPRTKTIKRPIEPRMDEDNLSHLLDCLGAGLTIKVFASLLLERKVIIMGDQLSLVSSCLEGLQSALYPLVWQQPLISCVPKQIGQVTLDALVSSCLEGLQSALYPLVWQQPLISCVPKQIGRAALEAPLPLLAGTLPQEHVPPNEGMLIDLTSQSKLLYYQGDESTILPTTSYKTLKTALQIEMKQKEDKKMRNMLISEAFLRFFVDILGDFWRFFKHGVVEERRFGRGDVVFDKEAFLKSATSKQNQYFLEWFVETAMFNHFIQNMSALYHNRQTPLHERKIKNDTTPSSEVNKNLIKSANTSPLIDSKKLKIETEKFKFGTPSSETNKKKTKVDNNDLARSSDANKKTRTDSELAPSSESSSNNDATSSDVFDRDTLSGNNGVSRENSIESYMDLIDTPFPDYYNLFNERVRSKYYRNDSDKLSDKNVKTTMNKRVKHLKNKLRELIT